MLHKIYSLFLKSFFKFFLIKNTAEMSLNIYFLIQFCNLLKFIHVPYFLIYAGGKYILVDFNVVNRNRFNSLFTAANLYKFYI